MIRYRRKLVEHRTSKLQRLGNVLQDAGIKADSVASSVTPKSVRAMVEALIDGERRPAVLADLARGSMRSKIPDLQRALEGRFDDHHALMCRLHLAHLDHGGAEAGVVGAGVMTSVVTAGCVFVVVGGGGNGCCSGGAGPPVAGACTGGAGSVVGPSDAGAGDGGGAAVVVTPGLWRGPGAVGLVAGGQPDRHGGTHQQHRHRRAGDDHGRQAIPRDWRGLGLGLRMGIVVEAQRRAGRCVARGRPDVGVLVGLRPGQSGLQDRRRRIGRAVAVAEVTAVSTVALVSPGLRAAHNAPPKAAVNCGRGVLTTGTQKRPDSVVVTAGIFAPPPTETIATSSAVRIPLRARVCSKALPTLSSESRIVSSSSLRVNRISPPNASVSVVTVLDESRSLALRHSIRSLVSEPIAEVPAGSNAPVPGSSDMT